VGGRVLLLFAMTANLTQFQGRYLDLLLSGTMPFGPPFVDAGLSTAIGELVISANMLAVLVLPLTALLLGASLGMTLDSLLPRQGARSAAHLLLIVARLAITLIALWLGALVLSLNPIPILGQPPPDISMLPQGQLWLGAFLGVAEGDLGLMLVHLPYVGRLWA